MAPITKKTGKIMEKEPQFGDRHILGPEECDAAENCDLYKRTYGYNRDNHFVHMVKLYYWLIPPMRPPETGQGKNVTICVIQSEIQDRHILDHMAHQLESHSWAKNVTHLMENRIISNKSAGCYEYC
jgi:hypothetical protein